MNEDNRETEGVYGGDGGGDGAGGVGDDDPCLLFVSKIVLRTLRMKHEKWAKLMATEEYKVCE